MRVGDTLRFKRDIVDATTKHRALFAAMIGSRFTERSGCDGQPYVTPLERESITNATFNLGLPALADSEVFYVGNNVVEEYKNRALGPDPRQLGTVHPYAKSGLVVFEQPLNINPNDLFHDYEPGEIETSIDPVTTIVPINALSWAVGNIPATDPHGRLVPRQGVVVFLWAAAKDLREAYRKANGSELSETRFAAYPLTYSSAGFGGWFIPESGVYHDDESISYTYDGFDPTTAAPSTAVCLAHTLWEMLEEEIFISTRQESSSKYRKMFKRMNINDTGVSIITLRHANYIGERDEEGRVIDWQYQWITRGHYRRITDKHTGEQKLVWVRAHRKGPADKPLRLTTKINAMTR